MLKKEILIFFTAIMFFTRIPVGKEVEYQEETLKHAVKYLPIIGWGVGGSSALMFYLSNLVFGSNISIILAMLIGVLITGAFHQDGLADTFDGFSGAWTKMDILRIMKDSRVGTFGVLALVFALAIKFFAIAEAEISKIPFLLIIGHSLSRVQPLLFIYFSEYVRDDSSTKVKPITNRISAGQLLFAFVSGILPLLLLWNWLFFIMIVPLIITFILMKSYFEKWIGGYTGDCLGAGQQIGEIIIYLSYILICNFR